MELCQIKAKQFSPGIFKFRAKHKDHFPLNCYMVPQTFLLIFHAGLHRLGCNNFRYSSDKEKTAGSARVPDYLSISYDYGRRHGEIKTYICIGIIQM